MVDFSQTKVLLLFFIMILSDLTGQLVNTNNYDVKYYRCQWEINPSTQTFSGTTTTYFKPLQPINSIEFSTSFFLNIDSIHFRNKTAPFNIPTTNILRIQLNETISQIDSLTIWYHINHDFPTSFIFSKHGPNDYPIITTNSEPFFSHEWWPCKESLTDKADSIDIFLIVPKGFKTASNGILTSVKSNGGKLEYHWKERYPIANYLIAFTMTNYSEYSIEANLPGGKVPIQYFVFPEDSTTSRNNIDTVLQLFKFYDSLFGPYPFKKEKYGHAQVTLVGGMENQTMSFVGSFDTRLLTHELAHSWFGNKITCGSWSDIWLNEGFAKYCEYLSLGYNTNPDKSREWLKLTGDNIRTSPGGSIHVNDTLNYFKIFDYRLSYNKAAYFLHMLRWEIGDLAFFNGVKNYVNDPTLIYSFARTRDLQRHLEQSSGKSIAELFEQWFYGEGYPVYIITWSQDFDNNIHINIKQNKYSFYKMHLPILLKGDGVDSLLVLENNEMNEIFSIQVNFKVNALIFDPDLHILSDSFIFRDHNSYSVFPNPAKDILTIERKDLYSPCTLSIFDATGHQLIYQKTTENRITILLENLTPGTYLLMIDSYTGRFKTKFIKI